MSKEGRKDDTEKAPLDLLSPIAMEEVAKVMGFGAKKYARHNWRAGIAWSRIIAAALRHIMAFNRGEDKDPETGISHIAHASCCLMFLLTYEKERREFDDRYKNEKVEVTEDKGCEHKYTVPLTKPNSFSHHVTAKCTDCNKEVDLVSYL